jgi:hypothetical protein
MVLYSDANSPLQAIVLSHDLETNAARRSAFRQHLVMRIFAGMQEPDADGGAGK